MVLNVTTNGTKTKSGGKPLTSTAHSTRRDRLTALLTDTGMSNTDFARIMDVHANTVTNWTTGKSEVPGPVDAYVRLRVNVGRALR